jgi:hypothetical protein
MHARTYGTLINTQVGIKEMVHRIFKAMVPRTNCKNVELDLLKRYTTLFAIRHLVDGGADQRLSQPCRGFATMPSNFRNLLTNWYITEDKVSNEQELNEGVDGSYYNFIVNISLIIYLCILFYSNFITSGFYYKYYFKEALIPAGS